MAGGRGEVRREGRREGDGHQARQLDARGRRRRGGEVQPQVWQHSGLDVQPGGLRARARRRPEGDAVDRAGQSGPESRRTGREEWGPRARATVVWRQRLREHSPRRRGLAHLRHWRGPRRVAEGLGADARAFPRGQRTSPERAKDGQPRFQLADRLQQRGRALHDGVRAAVRAAVRGGAADGVRGRAQRPVRPRRGRRRGGQRGGGAPTADQADLRGGHSSRCSGRQL
mmetsp:Transcript_79519/g.199978  ORF Transcript_79519/g.199978 Transcript_79519/m.199978 type:complete len:228 (+) Transcript_79519:240-923(+)